MTRITNREIAYILRLRNASKQDTKAFVAQVRSMSRDVQRSLRTMGRAPNPFANLAQQATAAGKSMQGARTQMDASYRAMAMSAQKHAAHVVREHDRIRKSADRLRASLQRGATFTVRNRNSGGVNRSSNARGGNSGAARAASVATYTGLAAAAQEAQSALMGLAAGAGLVAGARVVTDYADAWTNLGNRLAALGTPANEVAETQKNIISIANRARQSVDGVGAAYTRMLLASQQLGASQAQVAVATETVSKAMTISGATTGEANASILQLGQALGSGILNGDELRSIRENAPLVAQAIAKEFGVTVGQLKVLGEQGKLVADRVFKALIDVAPQIEEMFKRTRSTVSQSFSILRNNITEFIGEADRASGASWALSRGIISVANAIRENRPLFEGLASTFGILAGAATVRTLIGFTTAIVAMAGPIGIVVALIAGIAGYLFANQDAMVDLGDSSATIGSTMQATWEEIKKRIDGASSSVGGFVGWLKQAKDFDLSKFVGAGNVEPLKLGGKSFGEAMRDAWSQLKIDLGFDKSFENVKDRATYLDEVQRNEKYVRDRLRFQQLARSPNPRDTSNLTPSADLAAQEKARKDHEREVKHANDTLRKQVLELAKEQAMLGLVGQARERVSKLIEYQAQLESFETLTAEQRNKLMAEYTRHLDQHIAKIREYETAQNGVKEAINEYAVSAGDAFANAKNFMQNSLSSLEDTLVNFITTGKGGWKAMVQSMIADFMRLMVIRPMLSKFWKAMGFGTQKNSDKQNALALSANSARGIRVQDLEYLKHNLDVSHLHQNALRAEKTLQPVSKFRSLGSLPVGSANMKGVSEALAERFDKMIAAMPEHLKGSVSISSAFRSNERQAELWQEALTKYGSPEAARKHVAPPGSSNHNYGNAFDLAYGSNDARDWVHENASKYGMQFPMKHEPWHIEPIADGGGRLRAGQMAGAAGLGIDTDAVTSAVQTVQTSMNQLGTNIQTISSNAQIATSNFSAAGSNVQAAGQAASVAGPQFQQAGDQIARAGATAQSGAPSLPSTGGGGGEAGAGGGGIFSNLFSKLFSFLKGGLGGLGGIIQTIFGLFGGMHSGGIVGRHKSLTRTASAVHWANAATYHTGGIVGDTLKKGERRIIAKDEEAVMPTVRLPDGTFGVRSIGGGGGGSGTSVFAPSISVSVEGGSRGPAADKEYGEQIAKSIKEEMQKEMYNFTEKHSRPGGMLNKGRFT